ncbi:DNA polymerase I [Acidihalobacter prosperus]
MNQTPIILVDGSSYLYRAFHALPPLTSPSGAPTGAIYGVANMVRRLLKDYHPEYLAIIFDAKGKTFRDEIYSEYKAHRPPMPEDLAAQVEPLHALLRTMGLPVIVIEGVEADDVIGSIACEAAENGKQVIISSGDKDLAQLVNEQITLVNTMNGSTLDRSGVIDKFGVPPERIIDYLSLVGDSADNIPGVEKCGPKTAVKWLQAYNTLDGVIAHADEIKGKVGENLRNTLEKLPLSRDLVTLRKDLDLDLTSESLMIRSPDLESLHRLLSELGFTSWLRELSPQAADETTQNTDKAPEKHYETIVDEAKFERWFERLKAADLFAFDTETTDLDYMRARIVGISFALKPGEAAYIPLAHDYLDAPEQLDRESILTKLKPLLESSTPAKVGHHIKYDRNVLLHHGITLEGIRHDTMLESYVLDSTATRHDLDTLTQTHLGHHNITYEEVAGKGAKQITFNKVAIENAAPYAAEDADMTLSLHEVFWPRLSQSPSQKSVYEEIEIPLIRVLSRMECNGVLVNADQLRKQSAELAAQMASLEEKACDIAGSTFNLGSPKQLQNILYNQLNLPVIRKTPKGQPSTAEDVLEELAQHHDLPRVILEYRTLSKLKSTYTDRLPERIDPQTGRVHTSYHQAVASTGRLSSSDPNLQNIPIRRESGRRIREAFIAPQGHLILAADYSQIELRIMAHLSGDKSLLAAFSAGEDIHKATASEVFGVLPEKVSLEQRRAAKAINFGLIYGMSAFGLGKQLGIGRNEAQEYVDRYFERYPGVRHYMEEMRLFAAENGYVETLFGRRLYLPEINSRNNLRRTQAERVAINAPMQGTAADIIKRAMITVDHWLEQQAPEIRLIMQVHDELVLEIPESQIQSASREVRKHMENAANLDVPLVVDIGTGNNWNDAH